MHKGTWEARQAPLNKKYLSGTEGVTKLKIRRPECLRESDQMIVLKEGGKADYTGKRLAGLRSPQQKHWPNSRIGETSANSTVGDSRKSEEDAKIPVSKSLWPTQ